jgi:hypothetical protein
MGTSNFVKMYTRCIRIIITFVPPSVPFVRHLHKYSRRKQDSFWNNEVLRI